MLSIHYSIHSCINVGLIRNMVGEIRTYQVKLDFFLLSPIFHIYSRKINGSFIFTNIFSLPFTLIAVGAVCFADLRISGG